ncbi:MAG: hypothetical protein IPK34_07115 [Ramlibacter sp.]|nr:hypothetical protein [Ramlibacter sp.]
MGGFGSGRRGGRFCTDDLRPLDVRKINRDGLLTPGRRFNWQWTCNDEVTGTISLRVETGRVLLNYRSQNTSFNGGEWETMNYPVSLDWTDCGFGGQRVWWRCPAVGCGRRVAVLYGGRVFACRECHRLAYRSQREAFDDRATRRADKLRDRLGWEPGILNGTGWKPKGMHWRTFERLHRKHDANVETALAGMAAKLGILTGQLKDFDF